MTAHYPGRTAIDSYRAGGFGFAGMSHRGAIMVLPSGVYAWSVNPAALTAADFAMVLAEKAEIDLFLIGMGHEMVRPPKPVRAALEAAGIMYDTMATGHAVSTYNLLLEEKRRVAAALIPVEFRA
ncbi:MAG: MTH938/NDUFAF3 family protein [Aestuariivirga sp.]|uniref:Mth938-like domain-containing protein n=1 Tax=Aestuariivirga sp. TaxID=2650926 RepID=UPI00301A068B